MVRDGLITQFQAKQLLAGKHKGFFLGQYKFLDQIGSGGMGAVFLAEHTQMLRRVAIKILPPSKAQNESSLLRFKREAQAIAAVDHPNIVRAFDVGNEGGYHFLVLEYVEGVSLQELLNRGPLSVPHAANMIAQAALGLQHVHECGLIHRDIKPANLLLDRKGVVKILDLGLARMMIDEADDGLTRDRDGGVILGTADYLAPEQAINSSAVDIRADIYSLGITFYALLAGKPPFTDMTVAQKLLAHQLRPVVPLPTLRPDVPPELWAVIERMIAKDPAARFQTPGEVVQALLPWAQPVPLVMDTDDAFHLPTSSQLAGLRGGSQAGGSSKFHLDSLGRVPPGSTLALAPGAAAAISGGGSASSTQLIPALNPAAATPGSAINLVNEAAPPAKRSWLGLILLIVFGSIAGALALVTIGVYYFIGENPLAGLLPSSGDKQPKLTERAAVAVIPGKSLEAIAVFPYGKYVAVGGEDATVQLRNPVDGREVRRFSGQNGRVMTVAVSGDGKYLVSGSTSGSVKMWEAETGNLVRDFKGSNQPVYAISYLRNGKQFVSAGRDGKLRVYDPGRDEPIRTIDVSDRALWAVATGPNNTLVTAGEGGVVSVWNGSNGQKIRQFEAHRETIRRISLSTDAKRLITGSFDRTVKIWSLDTGQSITTFTDHNFAIEGVVFSPDDRYMLVTEGPLFGPKGEVIMTDKHGIVVYDTFTGQRVARTNNLACKTYTGVFMPDMRTILTVHSDGFLRIYDLPEFKK
jgi:serine/threonine protein kinase